MRTKFNFVIGMAGVSTLAFFMLQNYLRNRLHLLIQCVSADSINIILKLICLVFVCSILLHCQ